MNLGIIGLPQVGKKTIFKLLTTVDATKAPSRHGITYGMASVHDPRIDRLSAMYNPKKTRYAEFEIALPPDLQPEAARSADWIEPLRKVDALLHVVRAFEAADVFHVAGDVDPARDLDLVDTELLLADLTVIENRLTRIEKDIHKNLGSSEKEKDVLERAKAHIEDGNGLRTMELTPEELKEITGLQFLTLKPLLVVINSGEDAASDADTLKNMRDDAEAKGAFTVMLSAAIEAELCELDAEERSVFMEELGLTEPATHILSRAMYVCLGLMTFFTVGEDEVRGWPVRVGATAPEAAGKIHTDLQRGFIRADTITYDDLAEAGSEKAAREAKKYVLNGKDYIVKDGDVMEIRFSV